MTMNNNLFIHIGYPKSLSTTLQRGFFSKHREINYLGIGQKDDNLAYFNKNIEISHENLIKYATFDVFKKYKVKISPSLLDQNTHKCNVISDEHLSFKFDISQNDTIVKWNRLSDIYKHFNIKIIIIKRELYSFICSLFKELVRMGYNKSFNEFIIWTWNFKDRNFLSDLNYIERKNQLYSIFGKENIFIYSFEEIVKDVNNFCNITLSNILEIENKNIQIENNYPNLSDSTALKLIKLNKENLRGIGETSFYSFENHRNREWFKKSNAIIDNSKLYHNVVLKRKALEMASKNTPLINSNLFYLDKKGEKAWKFITEYLNNET